MLANNFFFFCFTNLHCFVYDLIWVRLLLCCLLHFIRVSIAYLFYNEIYLFKISTTFYGFFLSSVICLTQGGAASRPRNSHQGIVLKPKTRSPLAFCCCCCTFSVPWLLLLLSSLLSLLSLLTCIYSCYLFDCHLFIQFCYLGVNKTKIKRNTNPTSADGGVDAPVASVAHWRRRRLGRIPQEAQNRRPCWRTGPQGFRQGGTGRLFVLLCLLQLYFVCLFIVCVHSMSDPMVVLMLLIFDCAFARTTVWWFRRFWRVLATTRWPERRRENQAQCQIWILTHVFNFSNIHSSREMWMFSLRRQSYCNCMSADLW